MPTSVIGLFEDQDTARKVVDALTGTGVNEDAVENLERYKRRQGR